MANLGSNIAIWKISLRFFSPPEKPSFTERFASLESNSTIFDLSRTICMKSFAEIGSCPKYSRFSFNAVRKKLTFETPGISTGY